MELADFGDVAYDDGDEQYAWIKSVAIGSRYA